MDKLIVKSSRINNLPLVGLDGGAGLPAQEYIKLVKSLAQFIATLRELGYDESTLQLEIEKKRRSWLEA